MASPSDGQQSYWGYLINHQENKAQPLLEQLLEGLARVISRIEAGPDDNLTPQRLGKFYTSVGSSDYVFSQVGDAGLSLMYRTLGCFYSLEPSANAYEAPSIPCLKIPGFVRWQTVQLLLHPDEHSKVIQKAVEVYDVRKSDGSKFPKSIPRESFPAKPDAGMTKWQNTIIEKLEDAPNRIKNSPYASPFEHSDREGYFPPGSPHHRRVSRPPQTDSSDPRQRVSSSSSRRRSSVPSVPSPADPPDSPAKFQWSSDHAFSAPNTAVPHSPRHRPSVSTHTQRPPTQGYHRHSSSHSTAQNVSANSASSKTFNLNFENFHVPFISSPFSSKRHREKVSGKPSRPSTRHRDERPGTVSNGSDASSEESLPRQSRREDHPNHQRRGSLAPPDGYDRSKRRHSHDSSYLQTPTYPANSPQRSPQTAHRYSSSQTYMPTPSPGLFRDGLFNNSATSSAPESPVVDPSNPKLRVIDPTGKLNRADTRGRSHQSQQSRGYAGDEDLQGRRAASADRRSSSRHRAPESGYESRYPNGQRGHERSPSRTHERSSSRTRDRSPPRDRDRSPPRRQGRPLRVNTINGYAGGYGRTTPEIRSAGLPTPKYSRR